MRVFVTDFHLTDLQINFDTSDKEKIFFLLIYWEILQN